MLAVDNHPTASRQPTGAGNVVTSEFDIVELLTILAKYKKEIITITIAGACFSFLISFLLPKKFDSKATVLPPQQNGPSLSSMLGELGGLASLAARDLGAKNPSELFATMLQSRTIEDDLIGRFDLRKVYGVSLMEEARKKLKRRTDITTTKEGMISILVEDGDPKRAAALANAYVDELHKLNLSLAVTEAARRRLFFQQQLDSERAELAAAEQHLRASEEKTGLIHLDAQGKAMIEMEAQTRAKITIAEVQLQTMRSFATEENPEVVRAKSELNMCVADVRDRERLRRVCFSNHVDVIFHAAAYKHVPMMESNVEEAVQNNVGGLLALLDVAEQAHCRDLVMISTDKAVNPTSVMGATKRIGELVLSSRPPNGLRCSSVRFGNVLGSNGSVIPTFQDQLRKGLPLTVTHPEIQRFFMTIPEAVSLVLQAFVIGEHGDVLVLEMGPQVKIIDLARRLIRLAGKRDSEVPILFTGLRPGEKLVEELFYSAEEVLPTSHAKIKHTRFNGPSWTHLMDQLGQLSRACVSGNEADVKALIKCIVPEYEASVETKLKPIPVPKVANGHQVFVPARGRKAE